jgi:putative transposase
VLDLSPGTVLRFQSRAVQVVRQHDLEQLLVRDMETGQLREVAVHALGPVVENEGPAPRPRPADLEDALLRFDYIAPLLNLYPRPKSAVAARAKEVGASVATLYRLLAVYENNLQTATLARRPRNDMGRSRQPPEVLAVIDEIIETKYLSRQQSTVAKTHQAICERCKLLKLSLPSRDTVSRRIQRLSPTERTRRRRGRNATEPGRALRGSFPGAAAPLDVVQIDHTELDIMIVDEFERLEIGRPFITVAIDVMSRAVVGFHISLDKPSFMSAGSCLAQSMLPKERFLAPRQQRLNEIFAEVQQYEPEDDGPPPTLRWPVWGRPTKIHADNGREFRGKMLERSCQEYGIHVELRPVKRPWFGGHIERLMGTIATELHDLPGTTFSNPQRRSDYKSQKKAVLTFDELDLWLTVFFAGVYNQRPHSGLNGETPIAVFRRGLLEGSAEAPPKGLFPLPTPEEALKLQIDFLPSFEVTVQRYGIRLETITYYHEVLAPFLALRALDKPSERYIVRRDPRDLSQIYFYDPEAGRYYAIPFADKSWHRLSVWELRQLKKLAKSLKGKQVKEPDLINAQRTQNRLVIHSKNTTRQVRRENTKRRGHQAVEPLLTPEPSLKASPMEEEDEVIVPFRVQH